MKRILIAVLLVMLVLVGCQGQSDNLTETAEEATDITNNEEAGVETTSEKNPIAGQVIKDISTTDIEGNAVDATIFNGHKVNVLNLWATWCGPCVEEMPEFEEASKLYDSKDVQFLGLIVDSDDDEVKSLIDQLNITYPQIKADKQLLEQVSKHFDYVPVTLFVDENGKILDDFVPGGTSKEALVKMLNGMLNEE